MAPVRMIPAAWLGDLEPGVLRNRHNAWLLKAHPPILRKFQEVLRLSERNLRRHRCAVLVAQVRVRLHRQRPRPCGRASARRSEYQRRSRCTWLQRNGANRGASSVKGSNEWFDFHENGQLTQASPFLWCALTPRSGLRLHEPARFWQMRMIVAVALLCATLTGCRVMVKDSDSSSGAWEYRTRIVGIPSSSDSLNRYATNGWEIVSLAPVQKMREEDADNWMLLLRKRK